MLNPNPKMPQNVPQPPSKPNYQRYHVVEDVLVDLHDPEYSWLNGYDLNTRLFIMRGIIRD